MAKRKAGIPAGFTLNIERPADKPIRSGDYLDEIDALPAGGAIALATPPVIETASAVEDPPQTEKPQRPTEKKPTAKAKAKQPAEPIKKSATVSDVPRTRLNVSVDCQRKLDAIWQRMREYGPEKNLHKSEIIEALILAAYEARDQLDLSNVRRRGKYGSTTHKNFPNALAESVKLAISENCSV